MFMDTTKSYAVNPSGRNIELLAEDTTMQWDVLAATSGIVGLALIFLPYVSIVGLLLCITSIILGVKAKRKGQRKLWIWLGFLSGGLGLLTFLGVLGLIFFF